MSKKEIRLAISGTAQDEALATFNEGWKLIQKSLETLGVNRGELHLTVEVKGDLRNHEPKATITLYHYHYQNFESAKRVTGLEWYETADEFLRGLARDQRLLRLTQQSSSSADEDGAPF